MIDSEYIRRRVEEDNPYPQGEEMRSQLSGRRLNGTIWRWFFLAATVAAIIILMVLLLTIINQSFGLVVEEAEIPEETLVTNYNNKRVTNGSNINESSENAQSIEDMSFDGLVATYRENVSLGRCRAVEREQKFYTNFLICDDPESYQAACASENPPTGCISNPRTKQDVELLVQTDVIKPRILKSWFLYPSIFYRQEIDLEASQNFPNAEVKFRSWLSRDFVTNPQSSTPELAGVRTALLGSLWVVFIAIFLAFPLGVAAAIYLEEYTSSDKWYNRIIQTNINNLAGVPSIIYGMLGLAVFVRFLEPITSGAMFGAIEAGTTSNGRTVLSAGLTLGLLGLPIIIIAAQEAVKAVPPSLKEASLGLGATKWQTIWHHVLPNALPGILTGTILTMSRVIGETAPLVVVGAATFITTDPTNPFSKFTTLPAQIFQWTTRPQDTFRNIAGAAIIVLLVLLLMLNTAAIVLRNRFSKELT